MRTAGTVGRRLPELLRRPVLPPALPGHRRSRPACPVLPPCWAMLRRQQQQQLAWGAAGVAAVGLLALTLKQRHQQHRQRRQELGGDGEPGSRAAPGEAAGGGRQRQAAPQLPLPLSSWGGLLQGALGFKDALKERQLEAQLERIHAERVQLAEVELRRWDDRWALRSRPLGELRALAASHRIAGRSRMRRRELLEALEAALGFTDSEG